MALIESRIIDGKIVEYSKVQVAIQRLKSFEPKEGYWLAFSGGKDSVTIKALADMAGVKYEAHYSLTTVDPPELVQFIKTFPDVTIDRPKETMWKLIVRKGFPPTRVIRYCCSELKESGGKGRVTITGVRWDESCKRKANRHLVDIGRISTKGHFNDDNDDSRKMVENCYRKSTTTINVIIDWLDEDVWEFINNYNVCYCCLYDEGWLRLGCIGCPLSSNQLKEFERWPTYKIAYKTAFRKMIQKRIADGHIPTAYTNEDECFDWFVGQGISDESQKMDGQVEMENNI